MNSAPSQRIVGIVQPTYLPWLPLFERMALSDVFVLLDDVQYSKNSFHNRNAIKTAQGRQLLTAPVLYRGNSKSNIADMRVNEGGNWRIKHFRTIEQAYARAPFWPQYRDEIIGIYNKPCDRLMDIALPLIKLLQNAFQIETPVHLSSDLGIEGENNAKLVKICQHLRGTHFIVKGGTDHYHPRQAFEPHGIAFATIIYSKPIYPQLHGAFEPMLSALDYLLNCGPGRPPFGAPLKLEGQPA